MLMKHLVRRGKHGSFLPIHALEIGVPFVPQKRKSGTVNAHHMEVGRVAMRLLVGANRHIGDMGMHRAVCENQHQILAAGSSTRNLPQLDRIHVGYEVRFPHMVSGPDWDKSTLALEVSSLSGSF